MRRSQSEELQDKLGKAIRVGEEKYEGLRKEYEVYKEASEKKIAELLSELERVVMRNCSPKAATAAAGNPLSPSTRPRAISTARCREERDDSQRVAVFSRKGTIFPDTEW